MACSSCGTKGSKPGGCKSNGNCGTSGCNALNVYDWFRDMELPGGDKPFNIVEVRFKGSRKEFFRNPEYLDIYTGDQIVVESSVGYDVGTVSAWGEIVRLQLKKYKVSEDSEQMRNIVRMANEKDLERKKEQDEREAQILERARTISFDLKLAMKISDIEIQSDGRKVIFFYTAESRVDFRELIRRYADEFRMKIEMRHISYREEASRLGGIGDCGRELCCSTWLTDYKMVGTGAARTQNLAINMEKLAGQCGRLKCCLNFELDQYVEAASEFPKGKVIKIDTTAGMAYARKSDILKKLMWFAYEEEDAWIALPVNTVNDLIAQNKEGQQVAHLSEFAPAAELLSKVVEEEVDFIEGAELLKGAIGELKDPDRKGRRGRDRSRGGRDGGEPRDRNRGGNREGSENRGPRPEGEKRESGERRDRNRGGRGENRGPRPEGQGGENRNRGNREGGNRNENRGPRPEGERREGGERRDDDRNRNRGNREGGNRNENRGPRPEGERREGGRNENRGPRPDGEKREGGERREGGNRNRGNQEGGNRNENRGPKPERGPRPEGSKPNREPRKFNAVDKGNSGSPEA